MRFEWDSAKEQANRVKHGVSFNDASAPLASDVDYLEIYDPEHSLTKIGSSPLARPGSDSLSSCLPKSATTSSGS